MRQRVVRWHTVLAAVGASSAMLTFAPLAQAQQTVVEGRLSAPAKPAAMPMRLVTVWLDRVPVKTAVQEIARSAKVRVQFQDATLDAVTTRVTLHANQLPLDDALEHALQGTRLRAVVLDRDLLEITPAAGTAQDSTGVVAGSVVHAKTKAPIPGITVTVDHATKGVLTGDDGRFRIPASAGEHVVTLRGVGFTRQERRVTVLAGETVTVSVTLEPSTSVLNEVVVTGTVVATERKAITNPITVITAADIEKRGLTRIDQLFRGEVPGVVALEQGTYQYYGIVGGLATSQVYVRGSSAFSPETSTPLKTYIDGVELLDPTYLGTLDPQSIERIEIITGPQAATIYGSGALGGVMQIFTKKGSGRSTPQVTLTAKYGVLQSSFADGLTPSHDDMMALTGGAGPEFTYAGNLTHQYVGQWQPRLFTRRVGAQVGATHQRGPITATGSVSSTLGRNGTAVSATGPQQVQMRISGEWITSSNGIQTQQLVSTTSNQTLGFTLDYRQTPWWQHSFTVGRSQNDFNLEPQAPVFKTPSDSMYYSDGLSGHRRSTNYNTTLVAPRFGPVSMTLSAGANESYAVTERVGGNKPTKTTTTMTSSFVQSGTDKNYGGFATWRLGVADQLFITLGLRGEHNPNYGSEYPIDWTPTQGIAYTMERGELTVKLLASYGRATRPPTVSQRLQVLSTPSASYDPGQYTVYYAAPLLTPEYERGPQGGMELYYGALGSLTINRYKQTVSDLILPVVVDSVELLYLPTGTTQYAERMQNRNLATIAKHGWESTASLNFGPLSLRGTYAWNDSRIKSVKGGVLTYIQYVGSNYAPGASFINVPSHTGSGTISYARGGTNVTLVNNWIGRVTKRYVEGPTWNISQYRLRMYQDYYQVKTMQAVHASYVKSDLAASHRISRRVSATLNVINIGNSYANEGSTLSPALGRQTLIGLTWR